jgi:hypothetical protein
MKLPFYITLAIAFCLSMVISIVLAVEPPQIYEFSFWTKPNVDYDNPIADSRIVRISSHPCGTVAIAKVATIPSLTNDPTLEPEKVVAFSREEGKLLQRWATPVDSVPVAIRENQLLIEVYQSEIVRLWIDVDGSIAKEENQISIPMPSRVPNRGKCTILDSEFGKSAYADCWFFRDLENGKSRILAFEGICT